MAKNSTTRQKVLKSISAFAFAAMASFACLTAFAPTGARAASTYDETLSQTEMSIQFKCGTSGGCNGATKSLENGETGLKTDIWSKYQTWLQSDTDPLIERNANCDAAASFWTSNYNDPDYWSNIMKVNIQYQAGHTTYPAVEQTQRIYWSFGVDDDIQTNWHTQGSTYNGVSVSNVNTPTYSVVFQWSLTDPAGSRPNDFYIRVFCWYDTGGFPTTGYSLGAISRKYLSGDVHGDGRYAYEHVEIRGIDEVYPTGYEGISFNNAYLPPIPPNYAIPSVTMKGFSNWKGNFADDNFYTFDEVPFTCDGGLAPVLHGELWDVESTPIKLDDYTANATGLFTIELPEKGSDNDYKLISWYDCSDGINEFPDNQHYEFTITPSGSLKMAQLHETCMSATFPFIHFEECMTTIFTVIEIMFFGNVHFGNLPVTPEGCYTLTVAGDWLGLENKQVCPSYSTTVRNVTTPIVIFLLALAFIRIINRREIDG